MREIINIVEYEVRNALLNDKYIFRISLIEMFHGIYNIIWEKRILNTIILLNNSNIITINLKLYIIIKYLLKDI